MLRIDPPAASEKEDEENLEGSSGRLQSSGTTSGHHSGTGSGTGSGGFQNLFNGNKAKKYLQVSYLSPKAGVRFDDGRGSLVSLMLSSKVNTIEKSKKISVTLYGEDVRDAFQTSEAIGQCVSFFPRNINEILKDRHGTMPGCILLVDISGFTKLSSALCTQGSNGIDLLRKITDNSFAQFVECVYLHGGDGRSHYSVSFLFFYLSSLSTRSSHRIRW